MSRMSPEARSAAALRSGGKVPQVPRYFGELEAECWREIVRSKPVGWFDPSSLRLLSQYCYTIVAAQKAAIRVSEADPAVVSELIKDLVRLNGNCTTLATKLRLTVQTQVDSKSGMIAETGGEEEASGNNLLGGNAVWGSSRLKVVGEDA